MKKRQVLLEDGRYLIYYTFEDDAAQSDASAPESEPPRERDWEGDKDE